jgi:small subunit ribosomal protein S21
MRWILTKLFWADFHIALSGSAEFSARRDFRAKANPWAALPDAQQFLEFPGKRRGQWKWDDFMTEIKLKKGEPVDKALRRLRKKLDREQTLLQVRLHRRFEKPSAMKRRKQKAARFTAMLKARHCDD